MWLVAALAIAQAEVTFTRMPEPVEAGALEEAPSSVERGAYRRWLRRAHARAAPKGIDAALAARAGAVDACMRATGATARLAVMGTIAVATTGFTTVKAEKGAAPTLAACLDAALQGARLEVPLARGMRLTYTARWAPSDVPAPPAAAPSRIAFAPTVDEVHGFGDVVFGTALSAIEGARMTTTTAETILTERAADYRVRWLGAPVGLTGYAFGPQGLYAVTLAVVGVDTSWKVREALTARHGAPRWDNRFGVHYWRGERVLLQIRPLSDNGITTIAMVDMPRAVASGLADDFAGTPFDAANPGSDRRLPRIFRD